jgi:indolepyruvate ferredoxin oxidoreductase
VGERARGRQPRRQQSSAGAGRRNGGAPLREVSLDDRYLLEHGRALMTGVQALVRLALDQHRADRRRGLRTGTMVSGYQGSPLGGLDQELARNEALCRDHHVFHVPGLNEELGATSAWGSQLAQRLPGARYDGVLAMWYGKAPGLDRAADALRHGNYVGVSRTGGALAVVGDDPGCKSSTLPSASETALASFGMPVFFPGSVQEVLDLGLHAFACSRASGLWCGLKVVTGVADSLATAELWPDRVAPRLPALGYVHSPDATLLAPASLEMERTLFGPRTELALAYARENAVNRIEGAGEAWLGLVAAGKPYHDLRQALSDLGLGERELERAGIRILRLGMIWPLEPQLVRRFADGLDELLVVEEKRPFVEAQLKELLYGAAEAPRIVGKRDERGERLLPLELDLDADTVARAVASRLAARGVHLESVEARLRTLSQTERRPAPLPMAARSPFFCSGCPHNTSLKSPEGTLVGAGIGCHTMALLNPEGKGQLTGITQMGGEGAQWIGMAPFTEDRHFVQNLGDGTFHHSGSLAVRAAVAAGVNVTFKLLYNEAVAMTGGQKVEGGLPVPELTRLLEVEGVRRIVVTAEDLSRYRGARLSPIAELRPREELLDAQQELSRIEGVTVLIHDQQCAAERRRLRKRGKAPEPAERVWINERVCEGCGDCGKKSSCLSVVPVETEFGRKTQIHQASCNKDYSCLEGDCPSFLTVVPGKRAKRAPAPPPVELPEPAPPPEPPSPANGEVVIRMMGIGGTGVVTVNQIVGMAALIDGAHVTGLDQTGLSQKGGPVTSDLRISREPSEGSNRASAAGADVYLGFDLLGAANPKNLAVCDPKRTVAVVSTSAVATGKMVVDPAQRFPARAPQLELIDAVTRSELNIALDAQELSERLFADHMPANTIVLGAAWQRGLVPLSLAALERAIELNGVAVEKNRAAFAWGRAAVAAPDAVQAATSQRGEPDPEPEPSERERELIDRVTREEGELRRLLALRVPELAAYQDAAYAERYADKIARVKAAEEERSPGRSELTEAVARNLFKLMAYKDEYEVARLHLDAVERARLQRELGDGGKVWFNLQPPLLRALGLKRKLKLGPWFSPAFRLLYRLRRLRATRLDPFGWTRVRRLERELIDDYEELVLEGLRRLSPENHELVLELCELPEVIRGYEEIKLANAALFRERAEQLLRRLKGSDGVRSSASSGPD